MCATVFKPNFSLELLKQMSKFILESKGIPSGYNIVIINLLQTIFHLKNIKTGFILKVNNIIQVVMNNASWYFTLQFCLLFST